MNEVYPIHPNFDLLIQTFKAFSTVEFPRGIPQPALAWKDLIQGLTHYESLVIARAQDYLNGKTISLNELKANPEFDKAIATFHIRSPEDDMYRLKFLDYKKQIQAIAHTVEDCVTEFGNPYKNVTLKQELS
jgi:hypothetical protein